MGNDHSQEKKGKKNQSPQPVGKYSNLGGTQIATADEDIFIRDLDKELPPKTNEPAVGDLIGLSSLPKAVPASNPNVPKPTNAPINNNNQSSIKNPAQSSQVPLKNPNPAQPQSSQVPLKNANNQSQQAIKNPAQSPQTPIQQQSKPNNPPNPQVNVQPNAQTPKTPQNQSNQAKQANQANNQANVAANQVNQANVAAKGQPQVSNNPPNASVNNNAKSNALEVNKQVDIKPVAKVEPKKAGNQVEVKKEKLFEFSKRFEPSITVPNCQYSASPCHLNITEASTIEAELSIDADIPNLNNNITNWVLYASVPPITSFQTHTEVSLKLETPAESSVIESAVTTSIITDEHAREILQIKIDTSKIGSNFFGKKINLKLYYKANVYGRELFYDPNVQIPYQVATDAELYSAISSTESFSFANDFFYAYLQENSVLWRLDTEIGVDSIFFAHRVYQYIFNNFKYDESITNHQTLQQILANRKTNSYGLSLLFCTILRSQSLPARSVVGRWVINDSAIKKPFSSQIPHTLSEFFIEQVGWIPADITSMVLFGENMPFSAQGTMPFFGHSSSNFLGIHVDYDFALDSCYFGSKNVIDLLNPAIYGNPNTPSPKVHSNWKLLSREVLN